MKNRRNKPRKITYYSFDISIYHNGALAASATGSRAYPFTTSSYFNGFLFGSGYCTQNTTTVTTSGGTGFSTVAGYFTGQFDDVRVYTRALSSTEVTSLFNYR